MSNTVNRRSFLQIAGVGAVAATGVGSLAACGGSGTKAASTSNVGKDTGSIWPAYVASNIVKADLPGTNAGVQDAFLTYPSTLAAGSKGKPGDGSKVKAMVITYGAPSKSAADGNKFAQAVNDALGIDLELVLISDADYSTKFSTMMASGDLPDIMVLGLYPLPNQGAFIESQCADLTPYLSGDNVKKYPNLAAIPTYSWKNAGAWGGKLYTIPTNRPLMGPQLYGNGSLTGSLTKGMKVADFTAALQALSGGGKFGLTGTAGFANLDVYAGMFGAPSQWGVKNGQFTHYWQTDEYKATLTQAAAWFKSGIYSPDSLTTQLPQAKTLFQNGTNATIRDGYGAYSGYVTAVNGAFPVSIVRPFDAGATVKMPSAGGYFGATALKKAPEARIKMLLEVLNVLAAPFGTKEYELFNYGVEGTHFTRDKNGNPSVRTELGKVENPTNLPYKYLAAPTAPLYIAGQSEATKAMYQAQQDIIPVTVADASLGLQSDNWNKSAATAKKPVADAINDIVSGKRPVSDWDGLIKTFMSAVGTAAAADYAKELAG
jgi:putative aldouronate transport system substrate-binding protein